MTLSSQQVTNHCPTVDGLGLPELAVLFNSGPELCSWVVLADQHQQCFRTTAVLAANPPWQTRLDSLPKHFAPVTRSIFQLLDTRSGQAPGYSLGIAIICSRAGSGDTC